MPEQEQEHFLSEITSSRSPVVTPYILSPISSETSISNGSDVDIDYDWNYGHIQVPLEPTMREILIHAANTSELSNVTKIQLRVISIETSLQHMSVYLPLLGELVLDGSAISSLRDLGCGLKNLKILKVCSCGLTTLDGLLGLDTLEEFHAGNNHIGDLSPCGFLPDIRLINLKSNLLKDVMTVTFLTVCEKLEHLMLSENEAITETLLYRKIVKSILPGLKTLDETDISSEEILQEYTKYSHNCFNMVTFESEKELDSDEDKNVIPKNCYSVTDEKGQFVVSFTPKILSPRSAEIFNTDSAISSAYKIEDFPSFEEWLHTPEDED
ncbi:hypothetical protein RI129_007250 [Pyrocoelia pectoralis]|uniref:Leucine-rich repeat-containing protein 56 n=1 Tax=Pyrocoelia pectoralis TaxID=417401 RepID=A0AAN7V7L5_9COLE